MSTARPELPFPCISQAKPGVKTCEIDPVPVSYFCGD